MKTNFIIVAASVMALMSCGGGEKLYTEEQLLGEWHEVMPVSKHIVQGMLLDKANKASSVGMATLKYNHWKLVNGKHTKSSIVLCGESIGNGQTIQFCDTLNIIALQNDMLTLGKGEMYRIEYRRSQENTTPPIGGSDAAMGYTYSKVLDKKIRIFEAGTRLLSAVDQHSSFAAYVVFSSDSAKVEVFMPEETVVLERRVRPDGSAVWNVEDDDSYMLEKSNDEWIVSRRGKVVYSSTGFGNIIKAEFKNNKGEQLAAKFFTKAGVAQVTYLGVDYLLYQYVTASGYGYKNSFIDIRGKGKDMTLTFVGKDVSVEFTEQ